MGQFEKLLLRILSGQSDQSVAFADLVKILERAGFECRIKGSHHIFFQNDIEEILNIQAKGALAKAYQVKQVREIIVKYQLLRMEK